MRKKKLLFWLITILLPFFLFFFLEVVLRIFGLFQQPPLFIHRNQWIQVNPDVGERYFNKKRMPVPRLYPQTFSARKDSNTIRIFCLGGSSTAGFPYDMTVPFPQQLAFMLQADYPGKRIEVLNLGLSAINSFTVLDLLPEILEQQPDLILIYMGHNEFYGALGSGSTISFGRSARTIRLLLTLQKLHIVQMIKSLLQWLTPTPSISENTTLMEKVIGDKSIPTDSEMRQLTFDNFAENLDIILQQCKDAHVPVLLSKLVCNLKDQPPLDSYLMKNQPALKTYLAAKQALQSGDTLQAKSFFVQARDLDAIPFRAPSEINNIITQAARDHQVPLVDMPRFFSQHSRFGISGSELFCDHLHPNPIGYRIMANAFYRAMAKAALLPLKTSQKPLNTQPLFVTDLDWEIGNIRIFKLRHSWPFSTAETADYTKYQPLFDQVTAQIAMEFLFRHHIWGKAHSQMAEHYQKQNQTEKACQEYQAIVAMYPQKIDYYVKLLSCAKTLKNWQLVKTTCQRALNFTDNKGLFYYNLAIAERMLGHLKEALNHISIAAKAPELKPHQRSQAIYTYARLLAEAGQKNEALGILQALLKADPEFQKGRALFNQLRQQSRNQDK